MSINSIIQDEASGRTVKVGRDRALAVGPADFSRAFNALLDVDDVPVNIIPARSNESFCVTGIMLTGNKDISTVVDAVVTVYEAIDETTATSTNDILIVPIARSSQTILNGLSLIADDGKYINAVTTDDDVFVTILGFYINGSGAA